MEIKINGLFKVNQYKYQLTLNKLYLQQQKVL